MRLWHKDIAMPCSECPQVPTGFRLTVPYYLLEVARAQKARCNQTAIVSGKLADGDVSVYICNDATQGNMQLSFQAVNGEPIFSPQWQCDIVSIDNFYNIVGGIYNSTTVLPSKPAVPSSTKILNFETSNLDHNYRGQGSDTQDEDQTNTQEIYLDSSSATIQQTDLQVNTIHDQDIAPDLGMDEILPLVNPLVNPSQVIHQVEQPDEYVEDSNEYVIECEMKVEGEENLLVEQPDTTEELFTETEGQEISVRYEYEVEDAEMVDESHIDDVVSLEAPQLAEHSSIEQSSIAVEDTSLDNHTSQSLISLDETNRSQFSILEADESAAPKPRKKGTFGLRFKDGKRLNFDETEDGKETFCEICKPARSYSRMVVLKGHVVHFHGVPWNDYTSYIEQKELLGREGRLENLIQNSKDHRGKNLLYRTKDIRDVEEDDDDVIMKFCPYCEKFDGGNSEILLLHLKKVHNKNNSRKHDIVSLSKKLLREIPESRHARFVSLIYRNSKAKSRFYHPVTGVECFKCVLCGKDDFGKWDSIKPHVLRVHFTSWLVYSEILDMEDGDEKTERISEVMQKAKLENEKMGKKENPEKFNVYKYNGVDVIAPFKKNLEHPLFCPVCYRPESKATKLMDHVQKHHPQDENLQEILKKADDSIYEKSLATCQLVRRDLLMKCPYCDRKRTGALLFGHMKRLHRGELGFSASLLELRTRYKKFVRLNRNRIYPKKRKGPFKCSYCSRLFNTIGQHNKHKYYQCEKNPNRNTIKCKICHAFSARTQELLDAHIKRLHSVKRYYPCSICGKKFGLPGTRYSHVKEIHASEEERMRSFYKCEFPGCTKMYRFKYMMDRHTISHRDDRPHSCSQCEKTFKTTRAQREHINRVHYNVYRYRCDKCQHPCHSKRDLTNHICGAKRAKWGEKQNRAYKKLEMEENAVVEELLDNKDCVEANENEIADYIVVNEQVNDDYVVMDESVADYVIATENQASDYVIATENQASDYVVVNENIPQTLPGYQVAEHVVVDENVLTTLQDYGVTENVVVQENEMDTLQGEDDQAVEQLQRIRVESMDGQLEPAGIREYLWTDKDGRRYQVVLNVEDDQVIQLINQNDEQQFEMIEETVISIPEAQGLSDYLSLNDT